MSTRKPIVGGNWKMNLHMAEAVDLANTLADRLDTANADVFIAPAFPYLAAVSNALCAKGNTGITVAAQDFYTQANGAYTGEVSLSMLEDVGVKAVLVGHSERRHTVGDGERDAFLNEKVHAALEAGMQVCLCVGEKLEQREAGQTDLINIGQTCLGLAGVSAEQMANVVIAYEPVWAIGTGKTATADDAQNAHRAIRQSLTHLFGQTVADGVRIQYGGSCKPSNAAELFACPDVDGGLIGGAALKADDFVAIVEAAAASAG